MSRLCTCVLLTTLISEHLSLFQPNFGWSQRPLLASLTQRRERMQQISMFFSYWRIQSREPWHVLYQTHYKKKLMRNKFSSTLSLTKLPYFFLWPQTTILPQDQNHFDERTKKWFFSYSNLVTIQPDTSQKIGDYKQYLASLGIKMKFQLSCQQHIKKIRLLKSEMRARQNVTQDSRKQMTSSTDLHAWNFLIPSVNSQTMDS